MKCLTVQGYWAWAILHGSKDVENRDRHIKHRGPLAIACGTSTDWDEVSENYCIQLGVPLPKELPRGKIIGVVDVYDSVEYGPALHANLWASGPKCWLLNNKRPLKEPIPCRGMPGVFNLPAEIVQALAAQGSKA